VGATRGKRVSVLNLLKASERSHKKHTCITNKFLNRNVSGQRHVRRITVRCASDFDEGSLELLVHVESAARKMEYYNCGDANDNKGNENANSKGHRCPYADPALASCRLQLSYRSVCLEKRATVRCSPPGLIHDNTVAKRSTSRASAASTTS
jgi:hypothetical protein